MAFMADEELDEELEEQEHDDPPSVLDPDPALRDPRQVLQRYKLALELLVEALPIAAYALRDPHVSLRQQLDFWRNYAALLRVMILLDDLTSDHFFIAIREKPDDDLRTIDDEIYDIERLLKAPHGSFLAIHDPHFLPSTE